ncbi:MAG: hypothetical protein ACRDTD_29345, partial [Pseudonocardiaceae bacterium]
QGTVLPGYGASAAGLLPASVWLTLSLHNTEDALQATVTIVNAGSRRRALFGKTYAALAGVLVLTGAALIWPAVAAAQLPAPGDLTVGIAAHLICALTGMALGTCCIRPIFERQGHAFAAAALLSLVALVSRWLTPVNETVRLLSAAPPRPSSSEMVLLAVWALAMLLAVVDLAARLRQSRR